MSTATHETVLEAMAAGREAGVTDEVVRNAPSRASRGNRLPSFLELYPDTWPTHPGNPLNNDHRSTRHKPTVAACKRLRKAGDYEGAAAVLKARLDWEYKGSGYKIGMPFFPGPNRLEDAPKKKGATVSPMRRKISELEAALEVVRETNAALRAIMAAS